VPFRCRVPQRRPVPRGARSREYQSREAPVLQGTRSQMAVTRWGASRDGSQRFGATKVGHEVTEVAGSDRWSEKSGKSAARRSKPIEEPSGSTLRTNVLQSWVPPRESGPPAGAVLREEECVDDRVRSSRPPRKSRDFQVACIAEKRCKTRGRSHVAEATPTSSVARPPHEGRRDSPPVREPERILMNNGTATSREPEP